jgi:hypothetical protein
MNTTTDQAVADDRQHRLQMLLWQARIHEENGKKREASKIREWVAGFLTLKPKAKATRAFTQTVSPGDRYHGLPESTTTPVMDGHGNGLLRRHSNNNQKQT